MSTKGYAQKKQQIVDQSFYNESLFSTMSDLEAIEQTYTGIRP